jgi:mono/diheme cytochrome c family protein
MTMTSGRLRSWLALTMAAVLMAPALARAGADEGKALYEKQCRICHKIGGEGGKMSDKGGPLDGVGAKRDAAWLKEYVQDPKSKVADTKMPKMKLGSDQVDDLVAFLLTLKTPAK